MINTLDQIYVFLGAVYCGIIVGVWYDLVRLIRIFFEAKKKLCILLDLLFWIGTAALYFFIMLDIDNAQLRFYPFLGSVLGFVVYILGPSKIILKGFVPLVRKGGSKTRSVVKTRAQLYKKRRLEKKAEREAQLREENNNGSETTAQKTE